MVVSDDFLQDQRMLRLETSLGPNALAVTAARGHDAMNALFAVEVDVLCDAAAPVSPGDLLGTDATLQVVWGSAEPSFINGMVRAFETTGMAGRHQLAYRATLAPRAWLLTRSEDCRVYQNKTTQEIVQAVLADFGVTDMQWSLSGSYIPREYCVQYRETAWNFICRLLEEDGIAFSFRQADGSHSMAFTDNNRGFGKTSLPALSLTAQANEQGGIWRWDHAFRLRTGKRSASDYNFETPKASLVATEASVNSVMARGATEIFEYPGNYADSSGGQGVTRRRMELEESGYHDVSGESAVPQLAVGMGFKMDADAPGDDAGAEFVVTALDFSAQETSTVGRDSTPATYANSFRAIPSTVPYRPLRQAGKPLIHGLQTAVVTGSSGAEMTTDQYGRIKVQFFWDRLGVNDEHSSCWVRVAQGWAGKTWGSRYLPRIGQEVVVSFLEGDPDRPLVIGSVYNAEQMPPFALPANATQSGLRTRSSLGGGAANNNEFRFEDKMGAEQVFLHAERNLDSEVEKDETRSVGHDRTTTIGHDETITVTNNRTESVGVNESVSIGSNRTHTIGANESLTVGASRSQTVAANEQVVIGASRSLTVAAMQVITVGAAQTITVGADQAVTVGGDHAHGVAGDQSITVAGAESTAIGKARDVSVGENDSLDVGKELSITAADQIVLKTGSATLTMKKNGDITIEGKAITIKGSGDVIIKGQKILQN